MAIVPDKSGNATASLLLAGKDVPFDHYNRTNAGDPTGVVTPQYAGERILDTTAGTLYQALGLVSNTWVQITI